MKPEDIARNIDERFFKEGESKKAIDGIVGVLTDFLKPEKLDTTAKDVIDFLRGIWERFSIGKYVDVFIDFAKAEKALYGFGERYRDHLMHVFNVHLIGLLVFSKILRADASVLSRLLKIRDESDVVPFPNRYDKPKRLYYLWSLASTFHDIAIPIDRREELVKGLGKYLEYFKIETEEFYLRFPFMTQLDIQRYSDLMSRLFASRISLSKNNKQPTYEIEKDHTALYLYLRSTLARAMNTYDHGVLAAYFLFKSIEEMFLSGKNPIPKYDLDLCSIAYNGKTVALPPKKEKWNELLKEFDKLSKDDLENTRRSYDLARGETKTYNDYVFEQDITRAALALALHNIDPVENPKIFPLKFTDFPLACLLILFDELQEYYRPEGLLLTEVVRCEEFPDIDVKLEFLNEKPRIKVITCFDLKIPTIDVENELLSTYDKWRRKNRDGDGKKPAVDNYDELVRLTWEHIFSTIEKKIAFGPDDPLEVHITVTLEGKEPCGKPLTLQSSNWHDSPSTQNWAYM